MAVAPRSPPSRSLTRVRFHLDVDLVVGGIACEANADDAVDALGAELRLGVPVFMVREEAEIGSSLPRPRCPCEAVVVAVFVEQEEAGLSTVVAEFHHGCELLVPKPY